jgi:hypothetical protein
MQLRAEKTRQTDRQGRAEQELAKERTQNKRLTFINVLPFHTTLQTMSRAQATNIAHALGDGVAPTPQNTPLQATPGGLR